MNYYYQAECDLIWLCRRGRRRAIGTLLLRMAILIITLASSLMQAYSVWAVGDIGAGAMAWLNAAAILLLQKPVFDSLRDYERLRRKRRPVSALRRARQRRRNGNPV